MDTSNQVTLTIFGTENDKVIHNIKPDNVELDAITGNTYINLRPVTNEPGWKKHMPDPQMPVAFTPQHNTTQLQPHWVERMDFSGGLPSFVGPNTGLKEQSHDPFLPSGSKRPIPKADEDVLQNVKKLAMVSSFHQMSMAQQQTKLRNAIPATTPVPPPTVTALGIPREKGHD